MFFEGVTADFDWSQFAPDPPPPEVWEIFFENCDTKTEVSGEKVDGSDDELCVGEFAQCFDSICDEFNAGEVCKSADVEKVYEFLKGEENFSKDDFK